MPERLESAMQSAGFKQSDLARVVGTTQQTIWKLVNGESRTTRYLLPIAKVLNVSPEYLTGDSDTVGGVENGLVLSADKHRLLAQFDLLDDEGRDLVQRLIDKLASDRAKGQTLHSPKVDYKAQEGAG